jgi:ABC-2 type transport system ATP-binding protein
MRMLKLDEVTGSAAEVVRTRGLRKRFGDVEAVRGIDIDVRGGEIFGFLGPNGAGKTTTLRMLTTLLAIDGGTATVAGFDVARQPARVRTRIGYVSQLGGSDELATGRENLVLQGRLYGLAATEARHRADALIERFELTTFAARRVLTYSGGQRRRLDVALGLIHEPALLFLDEPSTGLDPQNRANLWDHVRRLREHGTTVFLTTHYLEEADALCDRLVIIDHGEIVACGSPQELKRGVAGDMVLITPRDGVPAEPLLEKLRAEPYVREAGAADGHVRLSVANGGEALPQLLRLLDRESVQISSMSLSAPTLDDVFLRQTGRSLRDTARDENAAAPENESAAQAPA